jgi:hypothetical protein
VLCRPQLFLPVDLNQLSAGQFPFLDMPAFVPYLGLPMFRRLGSLRYASHVPYGDLHAIPLHNSSILLGVSLFCILFFKFGYQQSRNVIFGLLLSLYGGTHGVPSPALSVPSPMLRDNTLRVANVNRSSHAAHANQSALPAGVLVGIGFMGCFGSHAVPRHINYLHFFFCQVYSGVPAITRAFTL